MQGPSNIVITLKQDCENTTSADTRQVPIVALGDRAGMASMGSLPLPSQSLSHTQTAVSLGDKTDQTLLQDRQADRQPDRETGGRLTF